MITEQEGVIKYQLVFDEEVLVVDEYKLTELNACRARLIGSKMLGEDPYRYDGLGFGNISFRASGGNAYFYISATQTGHLNALSSLDLACVTNVDISLSTLFARGVNHPSSEAMTHAILYRLSEDINAVVHVHSPDIWLASEDLSVVATGAHIPYGTPEMALAVETLGKRYYRSGQPWVFAMKGHPDGVVVAGSNLSACVDTLLVLQERAKQIH